MPTEEAWLAAAGILREASVKGVLHEQDIADLDRLLEAGNLGFVDWADEADAFLSVNDDVIGMRQPGSGRFSVALGFGDCVAVPGDIRPPECVRFLDLGAALAFGPEVARIALPATLPPT